MKNSIAAFWFGAAFGLSVLTAHADNAFDKPAQTLNFAFGQTAVEADGLSLDDTTLLSLGWGVQHKQARFVLEYYHATTDTSDGSTELATDALYYSGYWLPTLYRGVKGVLGAGLGYAQQDASGAIDGKEGDFSYKLSVGLEYQVFPRLSVYGVFEQLNLGDMRDETAIITGTEQQRLALGVNYYFR